MRLSRSAFLNRLEHYRRGFRNLRSFAKAVAADAAEAATGTLSRRLARLRGEDPPRVIGVDASPFYEPLTGVGWYEYHLLGAIGDLEPRARFNLYGRAFAGEREVVPYYGADFGACFRRRTHRIPDAALLPHRILGPFLRRIVEPLLVLLDGNDVFFAPNYFLPRRLAAFAKNEVLTVHDLTYKVFPEYLQQETLESLNETMDNEISRADCIIAVSRHTAGDLERHYPRAAGKVIAIHSGRDESFTPPATGNRTPGKVVGGYILFVSTLEPRKNVETLVEAYEILRRAGSYQGKLFLAGRPGWKFEPIRRRLAASPFAADIVVADYVAREALPGLYRGAEVFVFPSHYEGFGFPLLEAMSCGTPTVAAHCSSLPEIGGEAVLYFEAGNAGELALQIRRLLEDGALRLELAERGLVQARKFCWKETARQTLAVLGVAP